MNDLVDKNEEERTAAVLRGRASARTKWFRALATKYMAPKSTVIARASRRATRHDSRKSLLQINMAQEEWLIEWIEKLGRRGIPPRTDVVRDNGQFGVIARFSRQRITKLDILVAYFEAYDTAFTAKNVKSAFQ
jgi:hypothetical protein